MNTLAIIFAIVVATVAARPDQVSLSQDTTGNYKLSYDTKDSSRSEEGFAGGKVVGTFTFADKKGTVHTIKYLSSAAGFTAEGADVPTPVQESAEVLAVRAAHQAKQDHQRAILPPLKEVNTFAAPAPASFAAPSFAAPAAPSFAAPTFAAPSFAAPSPAAPTQFLGFAPAKPAQVDNSAEIEAAKAFHFAAHEDALARLAAAYQKTSF